MRSHAGSSRDRLPSRCCGNGGSAPPEAARDHRRRPRSGGWSPHCRIPGSRYVPAASVGRVELMRFRPWRAVRSAVRREPAPYRSRRSAPGRAAPRATAPRRRDRRGRDRARSDRSRGARMPSCTSHPSDSRTRSRPPRDERRPTPAAPPRPSTRLMRSMAAAQPSSSAIASPSAPAASARASMARRRSARASPVMRSSGRGETPSSRRRPAQKG